MSDSAINQAVGRTIRLLRTAKQVSQQQLGDAIGINNFSRIETGRQSITLEQLQAAAQALGVSGSDVLKGAGY